MARRILKWFGITVAGIVGLFVLLIVGLYIFGSAKVNKTYDIQVAAVTVPTDVQSIERGRHFVETLGLCSECHGKDLSGGDVEDDPLFGVFAARNLTSGRGGIGAAFSDIDYVRAIRHGIGQDDKAVKFMPSEVYNKISDADLGAVIAYIKSLPPVDNEVPETSLRILGRILAVLDSSLLSATLIDHEASRPAEPQPGVTREYGAYLTFTCTSCHGKNLSGGSLPFDDPRPPLAPNITPGGEPGSWTEAQFFSTIRTGTTPAGRLLDNEFMPWETFAKLTDDELRAIWLYLQSLPALGFEE